MNLVQTDLLFHVWQRGKENSACYFCLYNPVQHPCIAKHCEKGMLFVIIIKNVYQLSSL